MIKLNGIHKVWWNYMKLHKVTFGYWYEVTYGYWYEVTWKKIDSERINEINLTNLDESI